MPSLALYVSFKVLSNKASNLAMTFSYFLIVSLYKLVFYSSLLNSDNFFAESLYACYIFSNSVYIYLAWAKSMLADFKALSNSSFLSLSALYAYANFIIFPFSSSFVIYDISFATKF